nr:Chain C, RNA-directed RNA polymerase NS5 [Tick-borne encephalitis virus]7QS9_E Chain E, RNA-directed RNA polymerase NS5 [Tick-borne encephalitis virus]
EMYYSTAV